MKPPTTLIGTQWKPKGKPHALPWKLTDHAHSVTGREFVQIEKYQGGRNSPAVMTLKRLLGRFELVRDAEDTSMTGTVIPKPPTEDALMTGAVIPKPPTEDAPQPGTTHAALAAIPDPEVAALAIKRCAELRGVERLARREAMISDEALLMAFAWKETPEGITYWSAVEVALTKGTAIPKPPTAAL